MGVLFHVVRGRVPEGCLYNYFIAKKEEKALWSREEQKGGKL